MNIRKFILQICGVFLSMTLSKTIEKVITGFDLFTLIAGLLIIFLSLNFFYAKFKQLNEDTTTITTFGFVINITTLSCFSAMPFFIHSFVGILGTQVVLRISDILLIFYNNDWKCKNIEKMENRWLCFDVSYLMFIIAMMVLFLLVRFKYSDIVFISIYFVLIIFEVVFDFVVNAESYGTQKEKKDKKVEQNEG